MKIAIIGFGGMAGHHLNHIIPRYNDANVGEKVEVKGVYDIKSERRQAARDLGLVAYGSPEEIWKDDEVEAVVIATPNDMHLPYTEEAARHGKHVISEKPASNSELLVSKMYEAAEKYGIVFTPHQNRRWDCDYLTMKEILDSDVLGRVYRIESRVMGSNGIPGDWRKIDAQGGGMMLDWGVHLIDQALLMTDAKVVSVDCSYSYEEKEEVEDGFDLEIVFENDISYRIVVDTNTFVSLPRWQMYGLNGTACINDWKLNGKIVTCLQRFDDKLEGIKAGNGFTKTMADRRKETVKESPIVPATVRAWEFYANFVRAIRDGEPTIVKKEQVLRVCHLMDLAKESARRREVVKETF